MNKNINKENQENTFQLNLIKAIIKEDIKIDEYTNQVLDYICLQFLSVKEYNILKNRYGCYAKRLSYRDLGSKNSISAERVRQIEKTAIDKLQLEKVSKFLLETIKYATIIATNVENTKLFVDMSDGNYYTNTKNSFYVFLTILINISKVKLDEIGLTVRSYNALRRAGYHNFAQLLIVDEYDLHRVRNLGKYSINEILKICDKINNTKQYNSLLQDVGANSDETNTMSKNEFIKHLMEVQKLSDKTIIMELLSPAYKFNNTKTASEIIDEQLQLIQNLQDGLLTEQINRAKDEYEKVLDKTQELKLEYDLMLTNTKAYRQIVENDLREDIKSEYRKLYDKKLQQMQDMYEKELQEKTEQEHKSKIWKELLEYKDKNKHRIDEELVIYKQSGIENVDKNLEIYKKQELKKAQNELDKNLSLTIIGKLAASIIAGNENIGLQIFKDDNNINIKYVNKSGENNE